MNLKTSKNQFLLCQCGKRLTEGTNTALYDEGGENTTEPTSNKDRTSLLTGLLPHGTGLAGGGLRLAYARGERQEHKGMRQEAVRKNSQGTVAQQDDGGGGNSEHCRRSTAGDGAGHACVWIKGKQARKVVYSLRARGGLASSRRASAWN